MKKLLLALALVSAGFVSSASAQTPGCSNCDQGGVSYGTGGFGSPSYSHPWSNTSHPWATHPLFGHPYFNRGGTLSRQPTLPVYMAAPWYLYWPYDGHFQTVAPMAANAPWVAPPQAAFGANPALPIYPGYQGGLVNPQFPNVNPAPVPGLAPNIPAPLPKVAPQPIPKTLPVEPK